MPVLPKLPAPFATFLLRIPLAALFLQHGFDKVPFDAGTAEGYGLSLLVWVFVVAGEIGAGLEFLSAGAAGIIFRGKIITKAADILIRFSGITMTCIMTGVIWLREPDSLLDVLPYDYVHVSLYAGGLYFALLGNAKF